MVNLIPSLLPAIKSRRLKIPDIGPDMVLPDYGGSSIANLPATICKMLGVPVPWVGLHKDYTESIAENYEHIILFVLDGLGLKFFQRCIQGQGNEQPKSTWNRFLEDAYIGPLTSVVPSTTSTALTTLWTGATPAAHGIVGYELWLKEFGTTANMITQSPAMFSGETGVLRRAGFNPETFLPVPTLGALMTKYGVRPFAYLHSSIAHSGLSMMHMNQVESLAYHTLSDLFVTLRNVIENQSNFRTFNYAYWGSFDTLAHHFGPYDERLFLEFNSFGSMLERFLLMLRKINRKKILLVITADHGLIPTPVRKSFDIKNHPELSSQLVIQPTGENRLPYLFGRPGSESRIQSYIHETWGNQFRLVASEKLIEGGLFGQGEIHHRLKDRLGDWIVIPQGDAYWWWSEKANHLLGRHGGLSEGEMVVPLIFFP
jgi:hypothetical protein